MLPFIKNILVFQVRHNVAGWDVFLDFTYEIYTYNNYSIHMCHVEDYGPVKIT